MLKRTPSHSHASPATHARPGNAATSGPFSTSTPGNAATIAAAPPAWSLSAWLTTRRSRPRRPPSRERGQDDLLAAVESRARRRSRIEQQPMRARLDEHGEAVADVEHERARRAVRRQLEARAAQIGSSASHAKRRPGRPAPQTANATPSAATASASRGRQRQRERRTGQLGDGMQRAHRDAGERCDGVDERRRPSGDARRATARASRARRAARDTALKNGIATRFTRGPTIEISPKYHAVSGSSASPIHHCRRTNSSARASDAPKTARRSHAPTVLGAASASKIATATNDNQNDADSGANGSKTSTATSVAATICAAPIRRRLASAISATAIMTSERCAGTAKPVSAA